MADTGALIRFEKHLISRGRSSSTARKYARLLGEFESWSKNQDAIEDLTMDEQLALWVSTLRGVQAPASLRLKIAAGRALCAFLKAPDGALADYKAPPLPPARPHPLPGGARDLRKLLKVAEGPALAAIALGGFAGTRVAETVSVRRADVRASGEKMELRIVGKGEKIRYVPLNSSLAGCLDRFPADGRLCPLSNSGARAAITRVAKRAGVTGHDGGEVSSHDLRATFASEVYRRTKDIRLVQDLLGHANIQTTQIYIGLAESVAEIGVEF